MDNVPEELIIGVYRGSEKVYFTAKTAVFALAVAKMFSIKARPLLTERPEGVKRQVGAKEERDNGHASIWKAECDTGGRTESRAEKQKLKS